MINKLENNMSVVRLSLGSPTSRMAETLHNLVEDLKRRGVAKQTTLSSGHVFTEAEKLQIEYEARKAVIGKG